MGPSFIVGAQAESYYGEMDKDNKKVDRSISVSSLKCNNINVNVNGLELNVLPPFLGGGDDSQAPEALEEGTTDANSFTNNGESNSASQINDFRFICINNNNNTVVAAEEPVPPVVPPGPPSACAQCFLDSLTTEQIEAMIPLVDDYFDVEPITTLEELCQILAAIDPNTPAERNALLDLLQDPRVGAGESDIESITNCLEALLLITTPT
jgi:hypothetical protein